MLNNWGATVHFAENGQEAIDMFGSHGQDIDVVLMDCEMPEMDGYSATRHIRSLERSGRRVSTPIIALTAHAMPEFRRRARGSRHDRLRDQADSEGDAAESDAECAQHRRLTLPARSLH